MCLAILTSVMSSFSTSLKYIGKVVNSRLTPHPIDMCATKIDKTGSDVKIDFHGTLFGWKVSEIETNI
jgi:hypothetical protein